MLRREIEVINKLGLHARAAAKLVKAAAQFDADIRLSHKGREVDGKSIMGVMMLAAAQGAHIELEISGSEADAAMTAIVALFESRFDEDE
ncbi:MAG: HPr family phosphocarrier protein [Gammaproteobacteria bacterium]|nr:HPr family phosphocarrier protein [Gammaproteobacteria bacterium]